LKNDTRADHIDSYVFGDDQDHDGMTDDHIEQPPMSSDDGSYDEYAQVNDDDEPDEYGDDDPDMAGGEEDEQASILPTKRTRSAGPDEDEDKEEASVHARQDQAFLPIAFPHDLHQQQANSGKAATVPTPNLVSLPNSQNMDGFNQYAQQIVNSLPRHTESNLPPILSLIYIPWDEPVYKEPLTENQQPALSEFGNARLLDIPWLPRTIPYQEEGWKLAVYRSLGAPCNEVAKRVSKLDPDVDDRIAAQKLDKVDRKMRKRMDDWRKSRGGLFYLEKTKHTYGLEPTKVNQSVLGGIRSGQAKERQPLTDLHLYFNCLWNIDSNTGTMGQPDAEERVPYPLYEPHVTQRFRELLQSFKSNGLNVLVPDPRQIAARYPNLFSGKRNRGTATQGSPASRPSKRLKLTGQDGDGFGGAALSRGTVPDGCCGYGSSSKRPLQSPRCGQCPLHCFDLQQPDHNAPFRGLIQPAPSFGHDNNAERERISRSPELWRPMNPFGGSDDEFWASQWTEEDQQEWDGIPELPGQIGVWPLIQRFSQGNQPSAFYHPLPQLEGYAPEQSKTSDATSQEYEAGPAGTSNKNNIDPDLPRFRK
jgi:hypothetical protein